MPLDAREIWYTYDGKAWILKGTTLSLSRGRIVVVTGPNASGKTTLLKVLGGLYRPQRGSVNVDGLTLWPQGPDGSQKARLLVVYVHDKPIMVKGTVLYNTALGLIIRGVPRDQALRAALGVLEELGIQDLAEKQARDLSAGQKQLVAIARAIAVGPRYLLLDEPTSNLDRPKRRTLIEYLRGKAKAGMGILVASHDPILIQESDEEYEMNNGVLEKIR